jgi:hypothetical protein
MIVVDSNNVSSFTPAVQSAPVISNNTSSENNKANSISESNINNLEEIDKALEESGLSTDTSSLNNPNSYSQMNNLDKL